MHNVQRHHIDNNRLDKFLKEKNEERSRTLVNKNSLLVTQS